MAKPKPDLRPLHRAAYAGDHNAARAVLKLYGFDEIAKEIKPGRPFSTRVRNAVGAISGSVDTEWDDQSYDRQVAIMQRLQPDAVVCVGTYPACAGFIRDMRDRGVDCPIATISFVGGGAMLKLLSAAERELNKDYMSRLVSSQVVPSYNDDSVPAVREYREAMDRYRDAIMPPDSLLYPHGKTAEREYAPLPYGFISLEGYLNAKLFVAILQRMGAGPRRADLAATVLAMGDFDLGMGQPLSFGSATARRQASDQVYYTVVRDDQFVPFRDDEWEAWTKR